MEIVSSGHRRLAGCLIGTLVAIDFFGRNFRKQK
jgi:hypothetical protein